ncbi:protein YIPF6, partial [Phenoliferia sp. Uapishka_3]
MSHFHPLRAVQQSARPAQVITVPPSQMSHQTYEIAPDDEDDFIVTTSQSLLPPSREQKGKGRAQSPSIQQAEQHNPLAGRIGSGVAGSVGERTTRGSVGGVQTETRYTGSDTLDEPVTETIVSLFPIFIFMRDLRAIGTKVVQVLHPTSGNAVLRDWDLWGPLVFCLALAVLLSMNATAEQSLPIFTGVFVLVWVGSIVITLNAKLLGGKVSFFQSLCVLGYCLFPLDIAALVSVFVRLLWVRIPAEAKSTTDSAGLDVRLERRERHLHKGWVSPVPARLAAEFPQDNQAPSPERRRHVAISQPQKRTGKANDVIVQMFQWNWVSFGELEEWGRGEREEEGRGADAVLLDRIRLGESARMFWGQEDLVMFSNETSVWDCQLVGLADLRTETSQVQALQASYLSDLMSLGVAGFRLDAAKSMNPSDIQAILALLSTTPYIVQEVPYGGGEPVTPNLYTGNGRVHEFRAANALKNVFESNYGLQSLLSWPGNGWVDSAHAVVFVNDHDTERDGSNINTATANNAYLLASIFLLAQPYGSPEILSAYNFTSFDQGAPLDANNNALDVVCNQNGWRCEQRWSVIQNMVRFHNAVTGTPQTNALATSYNQISFGRGAVGHIVINGQAGSWTAKLSTSVPDGTYCEIIRS